MLEKVSGEIVPPLVYEAESEEAAGSTRPHFFIQQT